MVLIFCNKCFDTKDETHQKFAITNCFHVFCEGCAKNSKNFCLICKKACKMLLIDENLPADVKNYFDPNSIQRLLDSIEKINNFAESQHRAYVKKNFSARTVYYKYKKSAMDMKAYESKVEKAISAEKAIITRLKAAHKSNVISTELFQLRSPPFGEQQDRNASMEVHPGNAPIDIFDLDQMSEGSRRSHASYNNRHF